MNIYSDSLSTTLRIRLVVSRLALGDAGAVGLTDRFFGFGPARERVTRPPDIILFKSKSLTFISFGFSRFAS